MWGQSGWNRSRIVLRNTEPQHWFMVFPNKSEKNRG
jgi:hypothetical protein